MQVLTTMQSLHVKCSIRKLLLQNYSLKFKHKLWKSQRCEDLLWGGGSNPWQAACRNEKLIYVTLLHSHSHHGMKRQREEQQKLHERAQLKWRTKDETQLPVDKSDQKSLREHTEKLNMYLALQRCSPVILQNYRPKSAAQMRTKTDRR